MTHWCRNVERDEAVRAAEDGRDGPLPRLEEAIETITHKGDDMATNGLRTERVTLEVTHKYVFHASAMDWPYMVANYFQSPSLGNGIKAKRKPPVLLEL